MINRIFWLYFLEQDKTKLFVYGLSLPTSYGCINSKPKCIKKLSNGWKLICYISICETQLQNIYKGKYLDFSNIDPVFSHKSYTMHHEKTLQFLDHTSPSAPPSPIDALVTMNIFHTPEFINSQFFNDMSSNEFMEICKSISNDRQNFAKVYMARLGCFEWAETPNWAERNLPFSLITKSKSIVFHRDDIQSDWNLHIILYSPYKEIILDTFVPIPKGEQDLNIPIDSFHVSEQEYWLFDNLGKVLHHEKTGFIEKICGTISTLCSPIRIDDKMTKQNPKLSQVIPIHNTGWTTSIPISQGEKELKLLQNKIFDKRASFELKEQEGLWFHRGTHNKLSEISDLLDFFNKITESSEEIEVTIVDPFISKESLSLLVRLRNTRLRITIISCWILKQNPDDPKERLSIEQINQEIEKTKSILEKLQQTESALSSAKWYNLSADKFHDRYIMLQTKTTNKIYMLSNSINNLLIKYDFCIVPLQGNTAINAVNYVKGLIEQCNDRNRIYPLC